MDSIHVYNLLHNLLVICLIAVVNGLIQDQPMTVPVLETSSGTGCCSCSSRGDPGLPGSQGPLGLTGIQGAAGIPGSHGSHGTNGIPGLHGSKGDIGLRGPPGPEGPKGEDGTRGLTGKYGLQGSRGARGHVGSPGMDGELGPTGLQGIKGEKGDSQSEFWSGIQVGISGSHIHSQSAFSAACSKEVTAEPIEDTILIFDIVYVNIGNDFDRERGTFNCRVNGTYFFIIHANKWSNQNDMYLKVMKNGVIMTALYEDAGYDYYDMASNSLLLHLVEEDQVWIQLHVNNGVYGGSSRMTTFSGWLIYEDPTPYD